MASQSFARSAAARVASVAIVLGSLLGVAPAATAQTQTAVEYYYAAWNYYFETSGPDEIAALDAGAFGGVWKRTGQTFNVWTSPASSPLGVPTCRFFTVFFAPKSSHFYTPNAAECNGLKATSHVWQFEGIAFYIALIDANGNCPPGTIPLYRFYNNGLGGAPNHRYTTSLVVFNQMTVLGWQFEGHPITKVFACVPSSTTVTTAEGLWIGSTANGSNIVGVILDTGVYYFLYGIPGPNPQPIAGVVQGTSTAANGSWASFDARDFAIGNGVFNATVSGSYIPRMTLNGVITEGSISTGFGAAYDARYEQPVSLAAAAGTFSGQVASSAGVQNAVVTLSAAGALFGQAQGCTFTGTAAPRGSVNVINLSVTFNGGLCIFGTSTLTGIAFYDAAGRTIYAAAPNAFRTDGFLFVGVK